MNDTETTIHWPAYGDDYQGVVCCDMQTKLTETNHVKPYKIQTPEFDHPLYHALAAEYADKRKALEKKVTCENCLDLLARG